MNINHENLRIYAKGRADLELRQRVLRELFDHPEGDAALYLQSLKERLRRVLEGDCSASITLGANDFTTGDIDDSAGDTSEALPVPGQRSQLFGPIAREDPRANGTTPTSNRVSDLASDGPRKLPAMRKRLLALVASLLIVTLLGILITFRSNSSRRIGPTLLTGKMSDSGTGSLHKPDTLWSETSLETANKLPSDKEYYQRIAEELEKWRLSTLTNPADSKGLYDGLETAILGCGRLLGDGMRPLSQDQRDQLIEECKNWRDGFVEDQIQLRDGTDPESIRRQADMRVHSFVDELLRKARA